MKPYNKVYWITTQRSADRQDHFLSRNLSQLGDVEIQKITGYDAANLKICEDFYAGGDISHAGRGLIGCYLSHILAIRIASICCSSGSVLIMEDDAILCDNFQEALKSELKQNQDDWDVLMLGGTDVTNATAYIIRSEVASEIADDMGSARMAGPEDYFMKYCNKFNIASSRRRLAKQPPKGLLSSSLYGDFRQLLETNSQDRLKHKHYSQYSEDTIIGDWVHENIDLSTNPRFLEIGALDGIRDSNCFRLATLGWRGLCIEPNPYHFVRLNRAYNGCNKVHTLCACVGPSSEIRTLHINSDGLSTTDPDVFADLHKRVYYSGVCYIPSVTPEQIVTCFGDDYQVVSIDAEGMDMSIVRSAECILKHTRLICVERDRPGQPPEEENEVKWMEILSPLGFTEIIGRTPGNIIVCKPSTQKP